MLNSDIYPFRAHYFFPNERFFLSFLLSILTHAIYYLRPAQLQGWAQAYIPPSGEGEENGKILARCRGDILRQQNLQCLGERGTQMKLRARAGEVRLRPRRVRGPRD